MLDMVSRVVEVLDKELSITTREKEKSRKFRKELRPHLPMLCDGYNWVIRKQDGDYYKTKTLTKKPKKTKRR